MRVLLDECVDRRLARDLTGHDVRTVPQMGWATIKNGELRALAAGQFDAFVTVDRNLAFQQHLPRFPIAVIVLRAVTNRLADLRPLVPELLEKFRAAGWALAALSVDDPGRSQPVRGRPEPRDARGMGPLLRKGGVGT